MTSRPARTGSGSMAASTSSALITAIASALLVKSPPKNDAVAPGLHGGILDNGVGVLAQHALVDEREEDGPAEDEALRLAEVGQHARLVDDQAVQHLRRLLQHVVEQDAGVGEDDALGREWD